MSTGKRPGRFGDVTNPMPERRAPLPLLTQPMIPIAVEGEGDPSATRHDNPIAPRHDGPGAPRFENPLATIKTETAAVLFGKPTQMMASLARSQPVAPVGPPPEIGLTQHHLPEDPGDPRLALVIDPDSERSAAFRVLRHHLLEVGRPQVVVVSSPKPGDGKTTTALNLALALAECGRAKVLLVETNLRHPQLSSIFKFVPPWCFAEQLAAHRHQPMMPWSLIEIPQLWLHVGAINPRNEKSQLLDGPAFAIAMERLRLGGYDHIVVDGPPVLGSADVNLMADAADTVVFALRARRSTTRDLRRAMEQLGGDKVAGTVLVED
jgi:Mrp family chromosome partitioning ATPase